MGPVGVGSVLDHAVRGMKENSSAMQKPAHDIATMLVEDDVTLSPEAQGMLDGGEARPDVVDSIVELRQRRYGFSANVKSAKVGKEQFEALLDVIAPE